MSDQGYPNLNPGRINEAVNGAMDSAKASEVRGRDPWVQLPGSMVIRQQNFKRWTIDTG